MATAGVANVVTLAIGALRFFFVRAGEKMLEETFGQACLTYKSRVRRWL